MGAGALVSVVDDDESVQSRCLTCCGNSAFRFRPSSAEEFLASDFVNQTKCLTLDISMPGMSGPDLQRELKLRRLAIPIVFITAHAHETLRPRLLAEGAVACLSKPFSPEALLGSAQQRAPSQLRPGRSTRPPQTRLSAVSAIPLSNSGRAQDPKGDRCWLRLGRADRLDIPAALWPERCVGLVSVSAHLISSQAAGGRCCHQRRNSSGGTSSTSPPNGGAPAMRNTVMSSPG